MAASRTAWLYRASNNNDCHHLTNDGGNELRLVVYPLGTLYNRRVVGDDRAAVPVVELAAVVLAVIERVHLARSVLGHGTAVAGRLRRNGHVLLHVVRQVGQLRYAAPVRHVRPEEDDLNRVGAVDGEEEDDDEHTPLVDADLADVHVQVALRHHNSGLAAAAGCDALRHSLSITPRRRRNLTSSAVRTC